MHKSFVLNDSSKYVTKKFKLYCYIYISYLKLTKYK